MTTTWTDPHWETYKMRVGGYAGWGDVPPDMHYVMIVATDIVSDSLGRKLIVQHKNATEFNRFATYQKGISFKQTEGDSINLPWKMRIQMDGRVDTMIGVYVTRCDGYVTLNPSTEPGARSIIITSPEHQGMHPTPAPSL